MIFITVGTHEQPFNRLLRYIDRYIDETKTKEWIICQSGYSDYRMIHSFHVQMEMVQRAFMVTQMVKNWPAM